MDNKKICPKCNSVMKKTNDQKSSSNDFNFRVWDLAKTGSGVTGTSTTFDKNASLPTTTVPNHSWMNGTSGHGDMLTAKVVKLVVYECPDCGYKDSFRE
jgi:hypothetical protein